MSYEGGTISNDKLTILELSAALEESMFLNQQQKEIIKNGIIEGGTTPAIESELLIVGGVGLSLGSIAGAVAGVSMSDKKWKGVMAGGIIFSVAAGLIFLYVNRNNVKNDRIEYLDLLPTP